MANGKRSLLVLQTAYPMKFIKERGLEVYLETKDPGKFFDTVITVNTVASLQDKGYLGEGPLYRQTLCGSRNIVIECGHSVPAFKGKFRKFGFLCSQIYFFFRFFSSLEWRNVKVIYSDDPDYNGIIGLLISRILRKPLVVGIWGNPARIRETTSKPLMPGLFRSKEAEARVEKFVLLHADALQVQNAENGDYPISLGISRNKVSLLPLAVGIADFHFLEINERESLDFNYDQKTSNIVCISRLEEVKHVDHVIKSMSLLKASSSNLKLHLIGAGEKERELRLLSKDLEIENQVVFHGAKSQEWISKFLPDMDLAIAPLTGRALLEIGLSGLPVVAYDVDWHNEIVIQNETGFLVEYRNIEQLSRVIEGFFALPESKRLQIGENMRLKALSLCDRDSLNKSQNFFYNNLLIRL